jgi:hypothetical protein
MKAEDLVLPEVILLCHSPTGTFDTTPDRPLICTAKLKISFHVDGTKLEAVIALEKSSGWLNIHLTEPWRERGKVERASKAVWYTKNEESKSSSYSIVGIDLFFPPFVHCVWYYSGVPEQQYPEVQEQVHLRSVREQFSWQMTSIVRGITSQTTARLTVASDLTN